jgi:pullulanase
MKNLFLVIGVILILFTNNLTGKSLFISDQTKAKKSEAHQKYLKKLKELDKYYSDKKLGSFVENGKTIFRLFAPSPEAVNVITFKNIDDENGERHKMNKDKDGVWEASIEGENFGLFYGYEIINSGLTTTPENIVCVDPYSKAVATFNTYMNPRKSIVVKDDEFDWEGDEWIERDWRDLIVYEMHIRDMTAHPSSGSSHPGSYQGLVEKGKTGGIDYIKSLGVNTVELLPAQEFANIEIPFKDSLSGRFNSWNPYERNHWGYMTAAFFAPEAYYSESVSELEWDKWSGTSARQINDFKEMVKAFHKEGIAVIMDVVYNHLSEYEIGNLKEIDKEYYFRLDAEGNFISQSYCGNDFKTERPMARRLIVESVLYWMTEYHIDGFRFDLGKLIDWETIEEIIHEAKKINPNVIFVCEPWGGGYDPQGFSLRGWGSWNDQIRNGIKGENPFNGLGWIFGSWYGNNDPLRVKSYVNGTLVRDEHGLFQKKEHSVNYLESHDGYTLGDFIRIGTKEINPEKIIKNIDKHTKLTPLQLKLNKLAALFLFTSQGITMIHSGQEFARSKVIPHDIKVEDENKGLLDHNSYEKDNKTNYINYKHAEINKELFDYYKGLIRLRNEYPAFRRAAYEDVHFFEITDNDFAAGFLINHEGNSFIVLMNANTELEEEFIIPEGEWEIIVDPDKAGIESLKNISEKIILPPSSGFVLRKK